MTKSLLTFVFLGLAVAPIFPQTVRTVAGTGEAGFSGDGGRGTRAQLANTYGVAIGPDGAFYICEVDNHRVRRLELETGIISTVAGNGEQGYSGDGGAALEAALNQPYEVRFDREGNMYFVEMQNHIVRRVAAENRLNHNSRRDRPAGLRWRRRSGRRSPTRPSAQYRAGRSGVTLYR